MRCSDKNSNSFAKFLHFPNLKCLFYLYLNHKVPSFNNPVKKMVHKNIAGKGENAVHQHFLLFQQYFLTYQIPLVHLHRLSADAFT